MSKPGLKHGPVTSLTERILHTIELHGPITNTGISVMLDADRNTVQAMTKRLVRYGEVEVAGEVISHRSGPAKLYKVKE